MVSSIWVLRIGLGLEFLGAILLSLDVLEVSVREPIENIYRTITELTLVALFLILIFAVFTYGFLEQFLENLLGPVLFLKSDNIVGFLITLPYMNLWIDTLRTPIFGTTPLIERLTRIGIYLLIFQQLFYGAQMNWERIKFEKDNKYIRMIQNIIEVRLVQNTIQFTLSLSALGVILAGLIGFPFLIAWIVPSITIIAIISLPPLPLFIGYWLERENRVKSGLRFAGFLILASGFFLQILWGFS